MRCPVWGWLQWLRDSLEPVQGAVETCATASFSRLGLKAAAGRARAAERALLEPARASLETTYA